MIGANNSPMNMFTGGGNEAFQRGMMIGNANSPFSTVADAMKSTLDRYNAHLTAQQEQANKLEQIKATGVAAHPWLYDANGAMKPNAAGPTDPDAAGPFTQVDPATGKAFYRSTTIEPTTGMSKVSWAPVSPNAPENVKQEVVNAALSPMLAAMKAGSAAPNMVQQGANGAVVDSTGHNAPDMVAQYMAMYPGKSREEIVAAMKKKGM